MCGWCAGTTEPEKKIRLNTTVRDALVLKAASGNTGERDWQCVASNTGHEVRSDMGDDAASDEVYRGADRIGYEMDRECAGAGLGDAERETGRRPDDDDNNDFNPKNREMNHDDQD